MPHLNVVGQSGRHGLMEHEVYLHVDACAACSEALGDLCRAPPLPTLLHGRRNSAGAHGRSSQETASLREQRAPSPKETVQTSTWILPSTKSCWTRCWTSGRIPPWYALQARALFGQRTKVPAASDAAMSVASGRHRERAQANQTMPLSLQKHPYPTTASIIAAAPPTPSRSMFWSCSAKPACIWPFVA